MENHNPLQRYFRQPAIYVGLPSKGKYYPEGTLDMPANGELPVYPMTAIDEITYRTSDALFNGNAVVNVVQSCVPNIKDAWAIPAMDMDTILVAIRIASYGHEMEFESRCSSCTETNTYGVDLRTILAELRSPDYNKPVTSGGIEIYFKSLSYKEVNENSMAQFEDQKLLDILPDADMPEKEKIDLLNQAFVKLGALTIKAIAQSVDYVVADGEMVDNRGHIEDFIQNCDRSIFDAIRKNIEHNKELSVTKPLQIKCSNCETEYETPFTLDVSNFFA